MLRKITKELASTKSILRCLESNELMYLPKRTTYILKRRFPPYPMDMDTEPSDFIPQSEHRIYDIVKDTNREKQPLIKIILLEPAEGVGQPGDVVLMKAKKARDFFILPKRAAYASPENIEKYSHLKSQSNVDTPSSPFAYKTVKLLESKVIAISMNLEQPWTIEPWHARVALRKSGIIVPESAITLPSQNISGPDLNLENKEFLVKVKINNREEARIRFRLHHVATEPMNRLPWIDKHWFKPAEPMFQEDAMVLKELNDNDARLVREEY